MELKVFYVLKHYRITLFQQLLITNFDEECDLDIVANHGRKQVLNYVMSNSLGFGGHNASIIFKKYGEE